MHVDYDSALMVVQSSKARQFGDLVSRTKLFIKWPGVAGASGAVARSTAAVWLRHVMTWSTTRRPGPRLGKTLRDADFRWLPLFKGTWFHAIGTTPHQRRSPPAGCFSLSHGRCRAAFAFHSLPAHGRFWQHMLLQSPCTWSLLAVFAVIAFPHTAAFGTVRLFFRSLLAHPFADFSHTIACGSFRLFGSLAHPFAGFS